MGDPPGRPKNFTRRHILEIKEDTRDWIEATLETFTERRTYGRNSRVLGAAIAAAGVYTMVRLVVAFGRGIFDSIKNLHEQIFTDVSIPVINVFTGIFGFTLGVKEKEGIPETETTLAIDTLKELGQFDPFAFGAALTAGGMVLSGINPGEVLKGIGSIIDALIPL